MATPAVPQYLGQSFNDVSPGHRFTLYGAFWEPDQGWQRVKNVAPADLKRDFGSLTPQIKKLRDALRARQTQIAAVLGDAVRTIEAQSIAPFVTGTGIEHPLENGMAFLNPYGLPYLPGSGVKGVLPRLRRAGVRREDGGGLRRAASRFGRRTATSSGDDPASPLSRRGHSFTGTKNDRRSAALVR